MSRTDDMPHDLRHVDRHFDELTFQLFLDAQLDRAQSRVFESHVAECLNCRALLHALQQESRLLSSALQEDDEPLSARLHTSPWDHSPLRSPNLASDRPTREFASWSHWAWALGFFVTAAASLTAWVDVLAPWADQYDQTGIQSSSLLIRLVMSIVFWKGWTNMLNTFQYAVCALIGILIGIALFVLLRDHWRKAATVAAVITGIAVLLGLPSPANAAEVRRGNDVTVPAGETVNNDLIAAGETVRVDGTVNGDLIAFSQNVTVDGHITGDVIAFGDMIRIDGPVDGNVRCFCNTLTLDGVTEKNLSAFAAHVEVNPPATINGGIIGFAGSFVVDGKVHRDLLLFVSNATLNGAVGGDIRLRGGRFVVGPTAQVAGRLHVISNRQPEIAGSAKLGRPLEYEFVSRPQPPRRRFAGFLTGLYLIRQIVSYGVAFLCGLLLINLFPTLFAAVGQSARHVGLSIGVGALLLIAGTPLLIFAVLLILAGAGAGFATLMLYIPVLYASQLFVGTWIGETVLSKSKSASILGQLAIGLLILRLLGMIPLLGFFVWTAAFMWGTGAIAVALWNRTRLQPLPPATA